MILRNKVEILIASKEGNPASSDKSTLTGQCGRVIVHAADAGYEEISVRIENLGAIGHSDIAPASMAAILSPSITTMFLVVYCGLSVASITRTRARAIQGASTAQALAVSF